MPVGIPFLCVILPLVAPTIEFSCTHNVVRHLQKEGAYSIVLSGGYDDGKVRIVGCHHTCVGCRM